MNIVQKFWMYTIKQNWGGGGVWVGMGCGQGEFSGWQMVLGKMETVF